MNDVLHTISDGLMGFDRSDGEGVHIKIGASPMNADELVIIESGRSSAYIHEKLGLSPLADAVMLSIENGSPKIICIPVTPKNKGEIRALSVEDAASPIVAVTGNPNNCFDIVVEITGSGALNEAAFKYSLNGGFTYSEEASAPLSGEYELPDTGVRISFTLSDGQAYEAGQVWRYQTTAPQLTNEEILRAIDRIRLIKQEAELVHIVGSCNVGTWAAVSVQQQILQHESHKPLIFVLEAYEQQDETMDAYVESLKAARKQVANFEMQVVAARAMYKCTDGVSRDVNAAGIICGLYARGAVNLSIGEVARITLREDKVIRLLPEGMDDLVIDELDEAGYVTLRQYDGLAGYFVTNARMMGPDGTDYVYAEDVRIVNKIIRETRKEALLQLQSGIDLEKPEADLAVKKEFIRAPLDEMVKNKEITSAEVSFPADAAEKILTQEKLYLIIRYVQRGIIRSVNIDVGRKNPYAS